MAKKLIQFDWAMKNILRQKANYEILEGFLSELLHDKIKIHNILESESNQNTAADKYNRVDILTENSEGEMIIVEIQNNYEYDYFQRMLYGASKAVTEYLILGQAYAHVKKVISVNIVYFNLGDGRDYLYHGKTEFTGITKNDELQPTKKQKEYFKITHVSDIFPQYYILKIGNFKNQKNQKLTPIDEWMYFFKNSELPIVFKAQGLKQAEKVLDEIVLSEKQRYTYDRYLDSLRVKQSEAESVVFMQEEFDEMKEEMGEMKEELDDVKEELDDVKEKLEKLKNEQKNNIKKLLLRQFTVSEIMEMFPEIAKDEILLLMDDIN